MNPIKVAEICSRNAAVLLIALLLVSCGGGGGTAVDNASAPAVSSTIPVNNATGVAPHAAITATFSENMDMSTISAATFTLNNGITGTVTFSGRTATFTPSSHLAPQTAYTATITTAVKNAAGKAMANNYSWSFTTGLPDITPPIVSMLSPANGATGVAVNSAISAGFNENMIASSVTTATFTLNNGVTGAVSYNGTTATFSPTTNLDYSTAYIATITTGVKDAAGNAMAGNYTWSFTTGVAPDTTLPTVSFTSPASSSKDVAVNTAISATFSEPMLASTISPATFTLNNGITGAVSYSGTTATFTPSRNLAYSTAYIATIATGVKDAAHNAMASAYTWTFTTEVPNPDTGITASQCYEVASDVLVACNSAGAIALNNAQDGMAGRDANAATNDNADGKLGFSYTAVTGGCVEDNVTGLMWEVKTTDGGLRDWANIYSNYSATYDSIPSSYGTSTDASGFVTEVNATNLCGYSDWRLPTADELQSIMDYGVADPVRTIDSTWFPNTQGTPYWTVSPFGGVSNQAWHVNFLNGIVTNNDRSGSFPVRLVRGSMYGSAFAQPYLISTDGSEVTDQKTGLIWRRCAEGMALSGSTCTGVASQLTHEAALQDAANQAAITGIAWRLPNARELSSIADKSLISPAIDTTAFPATPPSWFWSASPRIDRPAEAWTVNFNDGYVGITDRTTFFFYVRLVRAGQ